MALDSSYLMKVVIGFLDSYDYTGFYLDRGSRELIKSKTMLLKSDIIHGTFFYVDEVYEIISRKEREVRDSLSSDDFWSFTFDETRVKSRTEGGLLSQKEVMAQWRSLVQFETLIDYFQGREEPIFDIYLEKFDSLKLSRRAVWNCEPNFTTKEEIIKKINQGIARGFDEYSEYFDEEEIEDFFESLSSGLIGAGIFVAKDFKGDLMIVDVVEGSSAFRFGIKKDDQLIGLIAEGVNIDLFCEATNSVNKLLLGEEP